MTTSPSPDRNTNWARRGFTLIELLVVVLIIGVLAAIAIPSFLGQRRIANTASAKADLRNLASGEQLFFLEQGYYTDVFSRMRDYGYAKESGVMNAAGDAFSATFNLYNKAGADVTGSVGATPEVADGSFCVRTVDISATITVWNSAQGGIQPKTVTTCPATNP